VKSDRSNPFLPLLWPDPPTEPGARALLSKIRWSYSRRSVLEQCPRRYYYEYYGAALVGDMEDSKADLNFFKSFQNRHERIGSIGHLVISTYFRKARSGEFWSADRLCNWARDILARDIAFSKAYQHRAHVDSDKFRPALLLEYYYGYPDADTLASEAEARLLQAINSFSVSSSFLDFRLGGVQPEALIEHNLSVSSLPCRVSGKLDLAFAPEERVNIVDWKLGNPSGSGDDSLQLSAYALWASERFRAEPDAIAVYKAYLSAETVVQFPVSKQVLANGRARIIQDSERMAVLHRYGERGIAEAFTPCAQRNVCRLCPFQEICREGRAVVNA
jgi:hypothetical protein